MLARALSCFLAGMFCLAPHAWPGQEKAKPEPVRKRPERKGDKKALEIADRTADAYGGFAALTVFRQKGQLRGLIKVYSEAGSFREGTVAVRLMRRLGQTEDLKRIDLDLPDAATLSVGFDGDKVWGAENGEPTVLRLRAEQVFKAELTHNYETLLRNQELTHELKFVSREKKSGIEFDIVDVGNGEGSPTRFFVSSKTSRILHIEYDLSVPREPKPVRVRESFFDFRVVQNTLVPFRVERYENDHRVQEIQFTEIAYGITLDASVFKSAADLKAK